MRGTRLSAVLRQRPTLALSLTLWVQALTACTITMAAVLAPAVAPTLGLRVEQVGIFVGICYVLAMASGLVTSSFVPRFGALRLSQMALLACATGLSVMTVGSALAFVVAAVLIGWAYGITNPTAAAMLGEHAPVRRRGLLFSIKQTGVPAGIALAGSVGPAVFHAFGWRAALLTVAVLCGITALGIQPARGLFDHALNPQHRVRLLALLTPLRKVFAHASLRRLACVSLVYAMIQVVLLTFLVAFLHLRHELPLAQAAGMLAVAQLTSIVARPAWGWLADRWREPARLLGLLGVAMGVCCAALALLPVGSGSGLLLAATMACAATAIGWNGVFYAELVQQAPPGELATVTGGCQFMTFMGPMLGPPIVAKIVFMTGSYALALQLMAAMGVMAGVWMLTSVRAEKRSTMTASRA